MSTPEEVWAWYASLEALMLPGDAGDDVLERSERTLPVKPERQAPPPCIDCEERPAEAQGRCGRCRIRFARANSEIVAEARRQRERKLADRRRRVAELRAEGLTLAAIADTVGVTKATVIDDLRHNDR